MVSIPLRSDLYAYTFTVALDGVEVRLSLRWSEGCGAWYADLDTADGIRLVSGSRLTPGAPLFCTTEAPSLPSGAFVVTGDDPYQRDSLGVGVALWWVSAAELAA